MNLRQALIRQIIKQAGANLGYNPANVVDTAKLVAHTALKAAPVANTLKNVAAPAGLIGFGINTLADTPATLFHDPNKGGAGWNWNVGQNLQKQRDARFNQWNELGTGGKSLYAPWTAWMHPVSMANMDIGGAADATKSIAKSVGGMGWQNTWRSLQGKTIPGASAAEVAAFRNRPGRGVAQQPVLTQSMAPQIERPVKQPYTAVPQPERPVPAQPVAPQIERPVRPVVKPASVKTAAMTKTVPLHVLSVAGKPRGDLNVEVADNSESQSKGLSKRASLPNDRGMLFGCPGPFWMKDVNFPLDIIFLTKKGEVIEHKTMWPARLPDWQLARYSSSSSKVAYAIEAPGGWCRRHGVVSGDRVLVDKDT